MEATNRDIKETIEERQGEGEKKNNRNERTHTRRRKKESKERRKWRQEGSNKEGNMIRDNI